MTRIPTALRRRFWGTTAVGAFATGALALAVADALGAATASRWLAVAAAAVAYTLWQLRHSLDANHPPSARPEGSIHETLGLANGVTLARGWLYAWVAGGLLVAPPTDTVWLWAPAVAYGGGAVLDYLDGSVADTVGRRTVLGERLDLAFDTLGFLVAPLVAVAWGALPVWYLSISAARYLFRLGTWLRERRGEPVGELPESSVRRPLAGLQMAVIAVALLPATPRAVVWPIATVAMLPSLAVFARDYVVVTGWFAEPNAKEKADRRSET